MSRKSLLRVLLLALLVTGIYFLYIHKPARQANRIPAPTFPPSEQGSGVLCETQYFADWQEPPPASCQSRSSNGFPLPDPLCTPGGANPTVTQAVLRDREWRTRSVRNCASSEAQKHIAYRWYGVEKPRINSNQDQVCELDHLVPLELGGADGLGNIWPQCGPDSVELNERFFKRKDHVEDYLADQVRHGAMQLEAAQRGIASDWTQYLDQAEQWCRERHRC